MLSASKNAGANLTANLSHTVGYRMNKRLMPRKSGRGKTLHQLAPGRDGLLPAKNEASRLRPGKKDSKPGKVQHSPFRRKIAAFDSVYELLRLKLYLDQYNYDDIVIGFDAGTTPVYNFNYDSRYLAGINAPEGLSSFSSDGVKLSINFLPLPKQTQEVIKLDVEAQNSGNFTMQRTELDPLPKIYELWLMDGYKKDSLDLRADSNYVLYINKSDTASFGSNRFKVIIRQNPAFAVQLLDFNATKSNPGTEITWTTQNEENYTDFAVERSSDGGATFTVLDSLISTGLGSYSFTDKTPPAASDKYRLKMTDLNGTVSYSNVVTLPYGNSGNTIAGNITIYPNPTSGTINLEIIQNGSIESTVLADQSIGATASLAAAVNNTSTLYSIEIINISGKVIKTATSATSSWQDNVAALSPGTYIITVINNSDNKMVGRSTFVKL
jgi:hypothetical protein